MAGELVKLLSATDYFDRGKAKMDEDLDYDEAVEDFTKAIELDPLYAEAYKERGEADCGCLNFEMAIEDFTKAIELDPSYAEAYKGRGFAKLANDRKVPLEDCKDALKDCMKALQLDPENSDAYYWRGVVKEIYLKDYHGAIEDYTKAI